MFPSTNPNIAALLPLRAARHPAHLALVETRGGFSERLNYLDLERRVRAFAADLQARGVAPGEHVLVFVPMSTALYVVLLACAWIGAVAVFVDAWADRRRLDLAVAAARPRAFIGSARAHLLRLVSPAIRRIPIQLVAKRGGRLPAVSVPGALEPVVVVGGAAALVTFTSGSTGPPKAIARSHGFLWAQHRALAAYLRLGEGDIDMPTLPIFVLNNLASGVTSVLPDFDPRRPAHIDPARVYRQIVAEKVTTSSGSPAFYERLLGWCASRRLQLPLRTVFTGGAPVLPPLARLLQERVVGRAHVVYGSSEAEPIAGIPVSEMLNAEAGEVAFPGVCVGVPVPSIQLRLIHPFDVTTPDPTREAGDDVTAGGVGEIAVAGEHVLAGPQAGGSPDPTGASRRADCRWHRTGDAGWIDPEGRLWLVGRVSESVRRQGHTWWNLAVEATVAAVRGVRFAAYLSVPTRAGGAEAVLCVEIDRSETKAEIRRLLLEAIGPAPLDRVCFLAHIPRDQRHVSRADYSLLRSLLLKSAAA